MYKLESPCSYQGGKQRLAKEIVAELLKYADDTTIFYDLCCGSGSISLELINQGVSPNRIYLVDNGGFGYFWESIANNTFDLCYFKQRIDKLPEIEQLGTYLRELSLKPVDDTVKVYDYLLLQAGSFGSKWIGIEGTRWTNNTFRKYWKPTATSNRKSPVNPMMPMPATIYDRVSRIVAVCGGLIHAYKGTIETVIEEINSKTNVVVYIDPPYKNTTGFNDIDIETIVDTLRYTTLVSEGYTMSNTTKSIVYGKRRKGNINGIKAKADVEEVLNVFVR